MILVRVVVIFLNFEGYSGFEVGRGFGSFFGWYMGLVIWVFLGTAVRGWGGGSGGIGR